MNEEDVRLAKWFVLLCCVIAICITIYNVFAGARACAQSCGADRMLKWSAPTMGTVEQCECASPQGRVSP